MKYSYIVTVKDPVHESVWRYVFPFFLLQLCVSCVVRISAFCELSNYMSVFIKILEIYARSQHSLPIIVLANLNV